MNKQMEDPTKPTVKLTGVSGNAFAVMGVVSRALRNAGLPKEHIDKYMQESMAGDYNNLLVVAHKYANIH
tara:strand:+ start:288 stop:497 length:210 start_codon:yes stop_codon:yes gene_type:complete